jgi:hypothetical protein
MEERREKRKIEREKQRSEKNQRNEICKKVKMEVRTNEELTLTHSLMELSPS